MSPWGGKHRKTNAVGDARTGRDAFRRARFDDSALPILNLRGLYLPKCPLANEFREKSQENATSTSLASNSATGEVGRAGPIQLKKTPRRRAPEVRPGHC